MTDAATTSASREIAIDEIFPHAPETIWKTLTTPDLIGRWLRMPAAGFAPVVGTRFTFQTSPACNWDGAIQCEVLDVVPNRRLAFSWKGGHIDNAGYGSLLDTVVTFTLTPSASGTRLRMVHSGFVLPRNDSAYQNMSGGWKQVVPAIGAITTELN